MVFANILDIYPWGDKRVQKGEGEDWDDGNFESGDKCSPTWKFETGYTCADMPDIWGICGNRARSSNEEWDDGNTDNGDGCSKMCTIETGWDWDGGTATQIDTWGEIWGDGRIEIKKK